LILQVLQLSAVLWHL